MVALVGSLHALAQLSQEVVITICIPDLLAGLLLLLQGAGHGSAHSNRQGTLPCSCLGT